MAEGYCCEAGKGETGGMTPPPPTPGVGPPPPPPPAEGGGDDGVALEGRHERTTRGLG